MQKITPVVLNLVVINALVFAAQFIITAGSDVNWITDFLALHHYKSIYFKPYQVLTYMFMHANLGHIFFNMFTLVMFGVTLESVWGAKKFLIFYLICGLAAGITQMGAYAYQFASADHMSLVPEVYDQYQQILRMAYTVGASGAIMGVLAAFAYLFPNTELYLYFLFRIKAKYAVAGLVAIDLFGGFSGKDNIAHFAHLGGLAMGFILVLFWNKTNTKTFY